MEKVWYLSSCDSCLRIINDLGLKNDRFYFIDLKNNPINEKDLDLIIFSTKFNYEDLFNKRALKFRDIKDQFKSDEDFKAGILSEYTFIKRPIIQVGDSYFIGNSKTTVIEIEKKLEEIGELEEDE